MARLVLFSAAQPVMRTFLTSLLHRFSGSEPVKAPPAPVIDDEADAQAFESLAMTDELREALFPKTTQMVSAIFDRPAPLSRRPDSATTSSSASGGREFPILF